MILRALVSLHDRCQRIVAQCAFRVDELAGVTADELRVLHERHMAHTRTALQTCHEQSCCDLHAAVQALQQAYTDSVQQEQQKQQRTFELFEASSYRCVGVIA